MKLSIAIVSWNTRNLTLKCIKSIFGHIKNIDFEIFLVDNNSTDETVKFIRQAKQKNKWSNLHIIENKENLGFAKANNQAIKQAQGEYVLLLNSDTELTYHFGKIPLKAAEEFFKYKIKQDSNIKGNFSALASLHPTPAQAGKNGISKLLAFMDQHPEIGILGPQLLNSDGSLQRSCRRFPKLSDQLLIQLKFYNLFPEKIKPIRKYFMLDFNHKKIREVDQVMGAAMLIRKEVFDKIGLLDEKFWAVFEEVDFCKRAKDFGYKVYFYPDYQVIHHKGQSFQQIASLKKQINFNHSLYHYFRKYKPWWQLAVLWLMQPFNLFLTWLDSLMGIKRKVGKKKDL